MIRYMKNQSTIDHIFYHGLQSINVVDCPELQALLLFIGAELQEKDIPHRTKLAELIMERFHIEYKKILEELEVHFSFFFFKEE